jgi:hypothetical protein
MALKIQYRFGARGLCECACSFHGQIGPPSFDEACQLASDDVSLPGADVSARDRRPLRREAAAQQQYRHLDRKLIR